MNVYQYRVPLDSNVSSYFKTFPLSVWSHKHFIENTDILDFEQATRLWYDNLTTIRNLPGSLVNKELFEVITKRKMGDTLTINKKKRKYAEDEVHTSSVTTSAELLKATFEHHKKYTQQKLDVPATPSPPSTVISVKNQDNEFFDETSTASEKTKTYNVSFDEYTQVESEKTKQKSRSNFLSSSTSNPLDNKVLNPDISLSDLSYLTNDSTKSSSEELKDENDEEIKFNLLDISMELQREPTVKWEVGNINVTDRFRKYQKDVLRKAEREGLYYENIYELLSLSSIIVICWPCPYPIFTNQEWSEIVKTNPYTIENHFLPQEISASLHEASCENFIGKEVFMNGGKTTLSKKIATSFNNLYVS